MEYLGFEVGRTTIKRILSDHGIIPGAELRRRISWIEFLKAHWEVMAATGFLSVELLTPHGLVRCLILFFIDIQTRRVELGGGKINPDSEWMMQIASNQVGCIDGAFSKISDIWFVTVIRFIPEGLKTYSKVLTSKSNVLPLSAPI